jgi:hypothetical protein
MEDTRELERQIQKIKTALAEERDSIQDLETLIGERIKGELWGLGEKPLEKAAWDSFFFLEKNKDCLAEEPVTSRRRLVGPVIILGKRIWRALMRPYARMILERQSRFNRELVQLQLANLLRLEMMKKRLDALAVSAPPAGQEKQE